MRLTQYLKAWALARLMRNVECRTKKVKAWDGRRIAQPDPTLYQKLKMWAIGKCLAN